MTFVSVLFALTTPQIVSAAGYLEGYDTTPKPAEISWWSTIAYLVSLFLVFAFVVTAAYIASRYLGKHFAQAASADGGRILAHLPLGPNRSVCIVELAGRGYVLGVTDHQINLIREIDDADELAAIRAAREESLGGDVLSGQFGSLKSLVERIPSILKRQDGAFRR